MKKKTRQQQFNKATKEKIWQRQYGQCLFCSMSFHMEAADDFGYIIFDVMHYINKSQGGLGIEQNGVLGCRYHHSLLDNGNKGLREEMLGIMREHLIQHYPDWNEEDLYYNKWRIFKND